MGLLVQDWHNPDTSISWAYMLLHLEAKIRSFSSSSVVHIFIRSSHFIRSSQSKSDVRMSIGTVASHVFLSDQLCPVALILQVLKSGNVSYQLYPLLLYSESCIQWWHTQTRMKTRKLTLREKQAIWMLKEKWKSIRAIAKTKGMEKSRVWKPPTTPATNNYLFGWENNSSWWQTNHKSCENEP